MLHYVKLKVEKNGYHVARLLDRDGMLETSFEVYIQRLINKGYSQSTVTRYGDVVAVFLDYLTETGVYGTPSTRGEILDAVDRYLGIRLAADIYRKNSLEKGNFASRWEKVAEALKLKRLSRVSMANTKAAINLFLKLSEEKHAIAIEEAKLRGIEVSSSSSPRDLSQGNTRDLSGFEQGALMKSSMLGAVMRYDPSGITVPKPTVGFSPGLPTSPTDCYHMEFPLEFLAPLFDAATSHRDRVYWLLIAGTGIRSHEADQVRWEHIDIDDRLVFVEDPENLRYSCSLPEPHKLRFKGRTVSQTYFLQPFNDLFFEALEAYVKFEAEPCVNHDFVFQDIRTGQGGRPFYQVSDAAKVRAFSRACERIGVQRRPSGKRYSRHSLRHWYGVFTLNYLPLPGGYGLRIDEVQKLMGHKLRKSTEIYAREDRAILESKLAFADEILQSNQFDIGDLPRLVAERYEQLARDIRERISHDQLV